MARGPQAIDGEARDDGGEPRLRTFDIAGALPAKPRVLDDVLGVGHRSEHPVGEAEQPSPLGLEHRRVLARPHVRTSAPTWAAAARPAAAPLANVASAS